MPDWLPIVNPIIRCIGEDLELQKPISTIISSAYSKGNWYNYIGKLSHYLLKLNIHKPFDPATSCLYSLKNMYMRKPKVMYKDVYSNIICNSPN